jgi:hypothetical protein
MNLQSKACVSGFFPPFPSQVFPIRSCSRDRRELRHSRSAWRASCQSVFAPSPGWPGGLFRACAIRPSFRILTRFQRCGKRAAASQAGRLAEWLHSSSSLKESHTRCWKKALLLATEPQPLRFYTQKPFHGSSRDQCSRSSTRGFRYRSECVPLTFQTQKRFTPYSSVMRTRFQETTASV